MTDCAAAESMGCDPLVMVTISQQKRITEATQVMFEHRVGCLVVTVNEDDDTMVGIISERDILGWISQATPAAYSQRVMDIMTRDVVVCDSQTPRHDAWKLMKEHNIRHLPIVRDGRVIEMLSVRNLL
ncbi:MAG: CBS domain-containing protein [Phycisphaerales bacterium]|jgi:CBS domain-containing protein|nr:CBS domain-containing protein [Phycisphaerales bacterium]